MQAIDRSLSLSLSHTLYSSTVGEESLPKVDLRLYNNLLSSVAPESTTIPLILHCMLEQVYTCECNVFLAVMERAIHSLPHFLPLIHTLSFTPSLSPSHPHSLVHSLPPPPLQLCSTTTSAAAGEASHTKDTAQDSTSQHGDVLAEINNFISGLCIPTTAKRVSPPHTIHSLLTSKFE